MKCPQIIYEFRLTNKQVDYNFHDENIPVDPKVQGDRYKSKYKSALKALRSLQDQFEQRNSAVEQIGEQMNSKLGKLIGVLGSNSSSSQSNKSVNESLVDLKILVDQLLNKEVEVQPVARSPKVQKEGAQNIAEMEYQLQMYDNENRNLRVERDNLLKIIQNLEHVNRNQERYIKYLNITKLSSEPH